MIPPLFRADATTEPAWPPICGAFIRSLVIPLMVLGFFAIAPHWLSQKIHADIADRLAQSAALSPAVRDREIAYYAGVDLTQICDHCPPGLERFRDSLEQAGVCAHFRHLRWGLDLSLALNALLLGFSGLTVYLNRRAAASRDALIRSYRLGWRMAMAIAGAKLLLLIPLLAYGLFELTTSPRDTFTPN